MTLLRSVGKTALGSGTLLARLGAARTVLVEKQRRLPRKSASWKAIEILVEDIDAVAPLFATTNASTMLLNLNSDSELPIKACASEDRQVEPRGRNRGLGQMGETLKDFVDRVLRKDRIGKYDVQLLEQEIFPDGLKSSADADALIDLDRAVSSVHFSWSRFFILALTEFAVWNSGCPGYMDADKSKWLADRLMAEGATDRSTRALVAIAEAAECFDETFFAIPIPVRPTLQPRRKVVLELGLAA